MNKKRLLLLARYLETVPKKKFDMTTWKCGTKGCAIYHASKIPELKKAGLSMKNDCPRMKGKIGHSSQVWLLLGNNRTDTVFGMDAVSMLFDITLNQSEFIFGCEFFASYPTPKTTPKEVAKTIRQFVKSNGQSAL